MAREASTYRGERRNTARAERIILRSPSTHASRVRLGKPPLFYRPHQRPRECARRLRQMPWLASVGREGWPA